MIKNNNLSFDKNRVISYGVSHGAYLAQLCNAFAPNLFSFIIDNSAWMYPKFLKHERRCYKTLYDDSNKVIVSAYIRYDYLGKALNNDEELLDLQSLYNKFENNCNIIVYQGISYGLVPLKVKKQFCDSIKNCKIKIITQDNVNGKIFKNIEHCMDVDFIKTFDYSMKNYFVNGNSCSSIDYDKVVILDTDMCEYKIDYSSNIPVLKVKCKD